MGKIEVYKARARRERQRARQPALSGVNKGSTPKDPAARSAQKGGVSGTLQQHFSKKGQGALKQFMAASERGKKNKRTGLNRKGKK